MKIFNFKGKIKAYVREDTSDEFVVKEVFSGEYNKLNIKNIIGVCNSFNIPVYVDPKEKNFFQYKNTRLVKPNLSEFCAATNQEKLTKNFAFDLIKKQIGRAHV